MSSNVFSMPVQNQAWSCLSRSVCRRVPGRWARTRHSTPAARSAPGAQAIGIHVIWCQARFELACCEGQPSSWCVYQFTTGRGRSGLRTPLPGFFKTNCFFEGAGARCGALDVLCRVGRSRRGRGAVWPAEESRVPLSVDSSRVLRWMFRRARSRIAVRRAPGQGQRSEHEMMAHRRDLLRTSSDRGREDRVRTNRAPAKAAIGRLFRLNRITK